MTDAELLIRAIREIVAEELQRALERALVELREERAEAEREWMDVRDSAMARLEREARPQRERRRTTPSHPSRTTRPLPQAHDPQLAPRLIRSQLPRHSRMQ